MTKGQGQGRGRDIHGDGAQKREAEKLRDSSDQQSQL